MIPSKSSLKLKLNGLKDREELQIRLMLKSSPEYQLQMLIAFRPDASLRQINNTARYINFNEKG